MSSRRRPSVLVTAARSGSAVAVIRSLGSKGYRVIAGDSSSLSPGLHSRYTSERLLHPSPETEPEHFVDSLVDAVRRRGIDLIVPVFDAVVLPLAAAHARFAGICRVAVPDVSALSIVADKARTQELARRLDVPIPRTCVVSSTREALQWCDSLGWPLVLKPQRSRVYDPDGSIRNLNVAYAENVRELSDRMRRFEGVCDVLLQEYCDGVGVGVELLTHRGQPLAAFQHLRLREFPVTGGVSTFRQSIPLDAVLYDHAARLLAALEWTGLAMVEFKVGAAGPRLMEINGRIWGSLPLAVRSGMDFPARLAELLLFGPPRTDVKPDDSYELGVRVRNLELELSWIGQVMRGGGGKAPGRKLTRQDAIRAVFDLLNPRYGFDILSVSDPVPGFTEIGLILAKAARKAKRIIARPDERIVRPPPLQEAESAIR